MRRQTTIDDFFITPEERVIFRLRDHGGRVRLPLSKDFSPDGNEVLRTFGMTVAELIPVLKSLRRKRMVYYKTEYLAGYMVISLSRKMVEFFMRGDCTCNEEVQM